MKRAVVLVDAINTFEAVKKIYKSRLDYKALSDIISSGKDIVRKIAYVSEPAEKKGDSRFIKALKKLGFEIRILPSYVYNNRRKRYGCEVLLTIDAMLMAPKVDEVVLVSGNGNFVFLVEYLTSQGLSVEVVGFSKATSVGLKRKASRFVSLDNLSDKILLGKSSSYGGDQHDWGIHHGTENPRTENF